MRDELGNPLIALPPWSMLSEGMRNLYLVEGRQIKPEDHQQNPRLYSLINVIAKVAI